MAFSRGSKRTPISSSSAPPPRTLNVQQFAESRALELEGLHAIVAGRTNGDFRLQRSKRRRTTSHDGRIAKGGRSRKRRRLGHEGGGSGGSGEVPQPERDKGRTKLSRRARRKIEFQKNPESGFCVSGDGTRRLRTHLWHAKRFTMVKRWGFYLPLGLHGRGRGSRAVLKRLKSGALVHDASYCCPIQLEGPEDSLLAILRMVLVPSPSDVIEEISQPVFCGICYESAMLHHVGAPLSRLIAPVTYMWRPVSSDHIGVNVEINHVPSGCGLSEKDECCGSYRHLWIWVHAAAFNEGFGALTFACQKQMNESGVSVNCVSLEGQLAKLEVMGSKATQILQSILHPVSESCSTSEDSSLRSCSYVAACTSSKLQKTAVLKQAEHLPSHAILSLTVLDPRDLPSNKGVGPFLEAPFTRYECDLQEEVLKECNALTPGTPNKNNENLLSLWSKPEENSIFLSDSEELWVSRDRLHPPIDENILCSEKHDRRLKFFNMNRMNSGTSINECKGAIFNPCSVLLLKHNDRRTSCIGWSIILPLRWVKSFWIPLISHGAHAIGLRERRWIASDSGIPYFPFDFPDCKAYSLFMAAEAVESDQIAELRPLAVRPLRVPIPPPWDCVRSTVKEGPSILGHFQTEDKQQYGGKLTISSSLQDLNLENFGLASHERAGLSFQGSIARTSNVLSYCLKKIHGSHLFLFPYTATGKGDFSELMDKDGLNWIPKSINQMLADRELWFVRVLLRAYKEGVLEEGAIICAPIAADISRWTSRSDELEKLQIPQSSIKSYFTQQEDSCKWELQVPNDPSTRQSFRWPIGFVTTGFVRGSAKPAAVALCEATILSQLREQQWSEMQQKGRRPEIFVLVRNLRSAAYRLSLATVVLEQQENDVEFM